jgi:hypothetical protein
MHKRSAIGAVATLAIVLGVPAAAYAVGSKTVGFSIGDADFVSGVRVPSAVSSDYSLPATSSGVFVSDVYGCPSGRAAYNSALLRTLNNLPDQYIARRTGRDYCALQLNISGLSWGDAKYHFEVSPYYMPQPSGSGILGARW